MYEVITVLQVSVLFIFSIYFLRNKKSVIDKIKKKEYGMNDEVVERYYLTGRVLSYFLYL